MEIFIRRLPNGVNRRDLMEFLLDGLSRRWPPFIHKSEGKLSSFEILQITDPERQTVEFHGLANIEPASAAAAAISRLNGKLLRNKPMEVRKVVRRSSLRDRRKKEGQNVPKHLVEQRKQDRRRSYLITEVVHSGSVQEITGSVSATAS